LRPSANNVVYFQKKNLCEAEREERRKERTRDQPSGCCAKGGG